MYSQILWIHCTNDTNPLKWIFIQICKELRFHQMATSTPLRLFCSFFLCYSLCDDWRLTTVDSFSAFFFFSFCYISSPQSSGKCPIKIWMKKKHTKQQQKKLREPNLCHRFNFSHFLFIQITFSNFVVIFDVVFYLIRSHVVFFFSNRVCICVVFDVTGCCCCCRCWLPLPFRTYTKEWELRGKYAICETASDFFFSLGANGAKAYRMCVYNKVVNVDRWQ